MLRLGKTISFTVIAEAGSLNYGEGFGNISELKKINRADGNTYSFASRQAIRYDVVRLGNELFEWNINTVSKDKKTMQFKDDITIEDSVEMDLFGYLKTDKKSLKRAAVARLSHAIALEPYTGDFEFLTNMGLAERINETANLANVENHISLYTYTLTIDLSKVGIDRNYEIELDELERYKRVVQLLEVIKLLSRHIRGRQENLTPLFIIGGMYEMANPFFQGRIRLKGKDLQVEAIEQTMLLTFDKHSVKESTQIGLTPGTFTNEQEIIETLGEHIITVEQFFSNLEKEVAKYFEVSYETTPS